MGNLWTYPAIEVENAKVGKLLYKLVVCSWEHLEQSEESEKSTLILTQG